ncbi:hypothetical protein, partial [Salmonella enterica]|uniref:hypothetical protein n=1 Tax=Salmonella enterica TaxID=28901 RepID=UPI003D2BCBD9
LELKIGIPYALTALGILLLGAFTPGKAWPVFWSLMLAGITTYNVVLHIFRDRNIQNRACALQ